VPGNATMAGEPYCNRAGTRRYAVDKAAPKNSRKTPLSMALAVTEAAYVEFKRRRSL
jgi:hypothetical protein